MDEEAIASRGTVGRSRARKKKQSGKPDYTLEEAEEDILFDLLPDYPLLWDKGHRQHKNAAKRVAAFEELAGHLPGRSVEHLCKWYKHTCDTYQLVVRRIGKSGSAGGKPQSLTEYKCHIWEKLKFMRYFSFFIINLWIVWLHLADGLIVSVL